MFIQIFLFAILLTVNPITFIADRNHYAQEGEQAYKNKNYGLASQHYARLISDLEWREDHIRLNLAHSYFLAKNYELASTHYALTSQSKNTIFASTALNQLGYLASMNQDFENALRHFQEAILSYPPNREARYNYELIAKILRTRGKSQKNIKKKQDKKETKVPQKQTNTQNQDGNTNTEKLNPQKLKDLQINKEKAEAILKAIRNQEAQHIQQQKKKTANTQNSNLPDW